MLPAKLLRLYAQYAPSERGGMRLATRISRSQARGLGTTVVATGQGFSMDLDLSTYPDVMMAYGLYERDTHRVLSLLLKPGMTFLDGGANIGYFSHIAAKCVGQFGHVVSFEPDPNNRERLRRNIERNGLMTTIEVRSEALGSERSELTLYRLSGGSSVNHGMTSAVLPQGPDVESFDVNVVSAAEVVDRVPNLIKLDLEGWEVEAIRGMAPWFASTEPPDLIVEHNPVTSSRVNCRGGDILREVQSASEQSWNCYRIRSWAAGLLEPVESPHDLDLLDRQCNLLVTSRRCPSLVDRLTKAA